MIALIQRFTMRFALTAKRMLLRCITWLAKQKLIKINPLTATRKRDRECMGTYFPIITCEIYISSIDGSCCRILKWVDHEYKWPEINLN